MKKRKIRDLQTRIVNMAIYPQGDNVILIARKLSQSWSMK